MLTPSDIERARSALTRRRGGCNVAEVDAYLERAASALHSWARGVRPSMSIEELLEFPFTPVKRREEGYDADEVGDLAQQIILAFDQYESAAAAGSPAPGPTAGPPHDGSAVPPQDQPVSSSILGLRDVTAQLQYAAVRAVGSDAVRVVGPDGRAWAVTSVTTDPGGVVIQIG